MSDRKLRSIIGCLLGTTAGNALGLPYKGLSRNRIYKFYTPIRGHRLILNKGMISMGTEHSCMVAQSLIVSGGDVTKFSQCLAWRLRFWLLGFPAVIDGTSCKSILKLLFGFTSQTSGVNSAGNSAALRSGIIGVCYGDRPEKLLALVKASTAITHSNAQAELGAIAIAVAAYLASYQSFVTPTDYHQTLQKILVDSNIESPDSETKAFLSLIKQACVSAEHKEAGVTLATKLANNNGISNRMYDTVSIVIQVWLRNQERYSESIKEIIYLGGDTDTTAAILGGIIGASVGMKEIPRKWLDDILDFPRSVNWIISVGERLFRSLSENKSQPPLPLSIYLIPLRNIVFLLTVLFHGFYRLLPPY